MYTKASYHPANDGIADITAWMVDNDSEFDDDFDAFIREVEDTFGDLLGNE
jgi:hypothetical protein